MRVRWEDRSGASASGPVTVGFVGCAFNGGATTVPAGSTVSFRIGWSAKNRGLVQDFLNAVTTVASLDGNPIANADGYFGPIEQSGALLVTQWVYPTGITLGAGDSVTLTLDWLLSHQVVDGSKDVNGKTVHDGPGSAIGGPATCTVTGV